LVMIRQMIWNTAVQVAYAEENDKYIDKINDQK
jgi:hypothetical protein